VRNASLRTLWPPWAALEPPGGQGLTVEGRPLLNFSFALNYAAGGLHVGEFHATNLAIHIAGALVLFGLIRRTLELPGAGPAGANPREIAGFAWLSAALWSLHPLQTESVTYLSQRAESLMGLFYLLALYAFARSIGRPELAGAARTPFGPKFWRTLSWAACVCGMATKEVMASAPLVILAYDRIFSAGSWGAAWRGRRVYYCALASSWGLLAGLVFSAGSRGGTVGFGSGVAWWRYGLAQLHGVCHYLRLTIWPHPLVFDYGNLFQAPPWEAVPYAAVVAALAAATVWGLFRGRAIGFLGLAFFAILAPTSSFIPGNRQTLAEHRMYLPLAAVVIAASGLAWSRLGRWAALPLGLAAAGLALATAARNQVYASDVALWTDTAAHAPANPFAQSNLGNALARAGDPREAAAHFAEAIRLDPAYPDAYYNLGNACAELGLASQAVAAYEQALRIDPAHLQAHDNLGAVLLKSGQASAAVSEFRAALRLDPLRERTHYNIGIALEAEGRRGEAISEYRRCLELSAGEPEAANNLGAALIAAGSPAEALTPLGEAVAARPDWAEAHYNYGLALGASGRLRQACDQYAAAARLKPDFAEAHLNLANAFLGLDDPSSAAAQYEAALRLKPDLRQAAIGLRIARSRLEH